MVPVAVAAGALVACSAAMVKVVTLARRLAPLPRPIVLVGETGVGKRLLARFIHNQSGRAGQFIAVGATDDGGPLGPLERAHNGTLFLKDLPLWPLAVQGTVLKAIEEGTIVRRGAERALPLTCRLIVASQRPLEDLVADGRLLPALRWGIDEFVITVPPLRGRFADVAALSYHFLDRARAEFGEGPTIFEPDALDRLLSHSWPGNVRQLRGAVEWSWVQAAGSAAERIRMADLPPYVGRDAAARLVVDLNGRRELSRWAFERAGRSRKGAARLLGFHPNTIDNHLRAAAR